MGEGDFGRTSRPSEAKVHRLNRGGLESRPRYIRTQSNADQGPSFPRHQDGGRSDGGIFSMGHRERWNSTGERARLSSVTRQMAKDAIVLMDRVLDWLWRDAVEAGFSAPPDDAGKEGERAGL